MRLRIWGESSVALSHLFSILHEKVCCDDEIEDTIDCTPAYELDEKLERRLRDHTPDPSLY